MLNYNKLVVAIIGFLSVVLGPEVLNISATEDAIFGISWAMVTQLVLAALGAFGVWAVPNIKPPADPNV